MVNRGILDGTLTVYADSKGAKSKLEEVEAPDWKADGDCLSLAA